MIDHHEAKAGQRKLKVEIPGVAGFAPVRSEDLRLGALEDGPV